MLQVGAVVAGGLGLAACGDDGASTDTAGDAPAAAAETPAGGSTAGGSTTETGVGGDAGGIPVSEVPVGGGAIFPADAVVVTQPTEGEFKAFDTTCPHQGCAVSSVEGTSIICPCHGSVFDTATGDRVSGPATRGLTPKQVEVSGDQVIVS